MDPTIYREGKINETRLYHILTLILSFYAVHWWGDPPSPTPPDSKRGKKAETESIISHNPHATHCVRGTGREILYKRFRQIWRGVKKGRLRKS
jgi:hypothetical protein